MANWICINIQITAQDHLMWENSGSWILFSPAFLITDIRTIMLIVASARRLIRGETGEEKPNSFNLKDASARAWRHGNTNTKVNERASSNLISIGTTSACSLQLDPGFDEHTLMIAHLTHTLQTAPEVIVSFQHMLNVQENSILWWNPG